MNIKEGNMDKYSFSIKKKKQISPNDNMEYIIHKSVIQDTKKVLLEYADINPSNEGLVYWGGEKNGDIFNIMKNNNESQKRVLKLGVVANEFFDASVGRLGGFGWATSQEKE